MWQWKDNILKSNKLDHLHENEEFQNRYVLPNYSQIKKKTDQTMSLKKRISN